MPIPLIPAIIAGGVVVACSITSYIYWKELKSFFKGKDLVILGSIETGKTTMHNFLRYGQITETHKATRRKKKVKGNVFKLEDLKLKISRGKDISGQKDFEGEWKELYKNADICFYLFNSARVYNDDKEYIGNIQNHLKHIRSWKKEFKQNPKTIIIGTFADQIPIYKDLNNSNIQSLDEILRKKIRLTYGKIAPSEFFIGNLSSETELKKLVAEILHYLKDS